MTRRTLLFRSLRYHARSHLGVVLGAAVGSAALVGALLVGDSVRGSLQELALIRLGQTQLALLGRDRLFREGLASDWQNALGTPMAPVLALPASATLSDGTARANQVQLLGVDERFWNLAQMPPAFAHSIPSNGLVLNVALAQQLGVKAGDTVLLRVQKPSRLSRDAPITPQQDYSAALRLAVAAVASDAEFGRFSLQANQLPPLNAFVSLALLQERVETPGRANLVLIGPGDSLTAVSAQTALRKSWRLSDAQLQIRVLTNVAAVELQSDRIFLDEPVVQAALGAVSNAQQILTYFVNELRVGDRSTPYSMVAGSGPPLTPKAMPDEEILINTWLAEDLSAKPGDSLTLTYYVVGTGQRLRTARSTFTVRAIVPINGVTADRQLMPDFPGVAEAESTHRWNAGIPIDNDRIREKDEDYWKTYRGTPKAFVTAAAAEKMWASRFGAATAIRFPEPQPPASELANRLLQALDPASVGLDVEPVRDRALAASAHSMDFGGLFLGFSFFLIVAALVLMALLFQFGLEQRAAEVGTFLALGFRKGQVRWLLLWEGTALAFVGGAIGLAGGALYARLMVLGLTTLWRDAVSSAVLRYHGRPATFLIGLFSSVVVSVLTIAWVLRKQARQPARELLAGGNIEILSPRRARGLGSALLGSLTLISALAICGISLARGETTSPGTFFGAGALLLVAGLAFASLTLRKAARSAARSRISLLSLALRNATRRRRRSLATIALLACGSFIIAAIGANKLEVDRNAAPRSSGTGGFELVGQTTLPVVQDLNGAAGQEFFGLAPEDLPGAFFAQFRVREGDDASCLNLNRAQTPRLLGVRPELLKGRFTFAKLAEGVSDPWLALDSALPDSALPAIGDMASIQWALEKKISKSLRGSEARAPSDEETPALRATADTLVFKDERGRPFKVRLVGGLANSILQGNLVISEKHFLEKFPSESGYRMFLIDVPSKEAPAVSTKLSRALQDLGLELIPAERRLAEFNAVQNTYLNTFQVLGGLGLLLGSAGLGVVVLRNVFERRGELALLQTVGFRRGRLRWLILFEHVGLLLAGLVVGIVAALLAVLPTLLAPGAHVQAMALLATLGGVFISGIIWTALATHWAFRGELLSALRTE